MFPCFGFYRRPDLGEGTSRRGGLIFMQFCSSNVDFLLSKLFFFGVSSMGLRTMVGSGQKIEDIE